RDPRVIVPISRSDKAALHALSLARGISAHVSALHISFDEEGAQAFKDRWARSLGSEVPLGVSVSPYRSRLAPVLSYLDAIEVKWNMPLDAVLDTELERGEEILAHAEQVAEKLGAHLETEVLQAREAAAAIVDTAVEQGSELILLGMPYRKRLGRVYVGRTVEDVYVKAPCAVLAYRQ